MGGLMLIFDEEGTAREYSDEFDIVIHCESEEEREKAIEALKNKQWIPCSERLPKISSARLALRYSNGLVSGGTYLGNKTFDVDFPDCNKKTTVMEWMPLPKLYSVRVTLRAPESRSMMCSSKEETDERNNKTAGDRLPD